ncbi:TetR/AcrR family transcriptional regulator [Tamlana sp. 2201CG12-4]|uniref:TetR/AcrR family transcriptional regulator n=1 Tax=Tamlana sp. 2201CG12-4 TaxID=3112582 RepID=UPI002DBB6FEE|nr:TetR/AcrR family transcriptional regulator [Tamlana sp. 2201CG12-4]MEC3908461.1 TetR/AcrR family transcriptional regulator [Tamlana sp. 2201CG12-4]
MKTKQRIINQAIESYNTLGVMNVSSRDIAKTLSISHGNLDYHFPTKESLLLAIYIQMKDEASEMYEEVNLLHDPIMHFNKLLIKLETFHEKYSFFNLDVLEISRKYDKVSTLLNKTFQIRKSQMSHFYTRLVKQGYLKDEFKPGMHKRLQHTIRILITFWSSQKEILPCFESTKKHSMSVYVWDLLLPHMTEKGVEAYYKLKQTATKS